MIWNKKRTKANIMLLVLFIMFISSLLWLLVSQYVRNMIKISWLFRDYYTTYYYAYAWLELWLAQVNYRERNSQKPFGFEDQVDFSAFSQCRGVCNFDMSISSRSDFITDSFNPSITSCIWSIDLFWSGSQIWRRSEAYNIDPWDGFIIPLFYDTTTWFNNVIYETVDDESLVTFDDLNPQLYNDHGIWVLPETQEEYIVRIIDDNTQNYLASIEPTIWDGLTPLALADEDDLTYSWDSLNKNYLIIANATGVVKDFCLQLEPWTELPTKYITISSVAQLNGASVAFGAIKNNDLPSFIIYGTIATD